MIGLLKKPLSVDLQIKMKGDSLNPLVAQNKDLGAASQTLITEVKLRLRRCPNNRIFILSSGRGGSFHGASERSASASLFVHCFVLF